MNAKKQQRLNTFTAIFQKVRGGYTTWIEEMPNVISEGKTRAEAEENLKDALELMLETNRIMSLKDAVGNIERSTISLAVHPVA
jgi:predicted RNase H-like HicB family nuclease